MADPEKSTWGTKVKTSAGKFMGWNTIYGRAGEHSLPYMTRVWIGRLRLHIFHRGDNDPDHHDHPWDFWTFPLTPYVEEEVFKIADLMGEEGEVFQYQTKLNVVPAWRVSFRPAEHTHRVLGRYSGEVRDDFGFTHRLSARAARGQPSYLTPLHDSRKIVTIVWQGGQRRKWGFLKYRDGRYCWTHWKEYVFGGGKDAPCQ